MKRTTLLLIAVILAAVPLSAHEIGTTRVTVRFPTADTFRVEIVTDAQALIEKLETRAGIATTQRVDAAQVIAREDLFLDRLSLAFDTGVVAPALQAVVAPAVDSTSPPVATVTLTGEVPRGAHQFTWTYGWTFATYAFAVDRADGEPHTEWLDGGETSEGILLSETRTPASLSTIVAEYLGLGFTHIVPHGLDHMLFVLGLFLLGDRWRSLLWQVSAFTVAHTITLGLAMYGVVAVRPALVEPVIALSICYVAIENLLLTELRPWRVALVFAFGLLHGLGFAGVLSEIGLPVGQFGPALVAFNVGVEAGQLTVVAAAMLAVGWWRSAPAYRRWVVVPASLTIACVAMYWTVERL
jgi:hypothetical protein